MLQRPINKRWFQHWAALSVDFWKTFGGNLHLWPFETHVGIWIYLARWVLKTKNGCGCQSYVNTQKRFDGEFVDKWAEKQFRQKNTEITKGSVSYLSSPCFSTSIGGIGGPARVKRGILAVMYWISIIRGGVMGSIPTGDAVTGPHIRGTLSIREMSL